MDNKHREGDCKILLLNFIPLCCTHKCIIVKVFANIVFTYIVPCIKISEALV
jgi:hypothetical protein